MYIRTEVSDKNLANYLSNLTNSRVVYTPALKYVQLESLANIYEVTHGIKGSDPEGFKPIVANSQPGDNNLLLHQSSIMNRNSQQLGHNILSKILQ